MGDTVRSPCRQISDIDQHRERADLCRWFCILEEVWLHTPTKKGFQRVSLWHTTLLAKCSVLYALSTLLRKWGCQPGEQAHLKPIRKKYSRLFKKPQPHQMIPKKKESKSILRENAWDVFLCLCAWVMTKIKLKLVIESHWLVIEFSHRRFRRAEWYDLYR